MLSARLLSAIKILQEAGGSAPEYILSGAAGFASMGFLNRARNSTKHGKVLDALKENLRYTFLLLCGPAIVHEICHSCL